MTSKKTSEKKKPTAGTTKKKDEKLVSLEQQLTEQNEKLLRAYADIQNLQKRMEKELKHREQATKTQYQLNLMDIYELIQKALQDDHPKEGLQAIQKYMDNLIEQEGIRIIDCIGQSFDHTCHHAVCTVEKNDCADNEIIEEIKKGYYCRDHLLRPAQVVVAKKPKE